MSVFVRGVERWVWLKITEEGQRRFWSMFPLTRVPFWYQFFEPQPGVDIPLEAPKRALISCSRLANSVAAS